MKEHINSQAKKDDLLAQVLAMPIDGSHEGGITKLAQTRTAKQNRALHKYLSMLAEALNLAGWSYWATLLRKPLALIKSKRAAIYSQPLTAFQNGYLQALSDIEESLPRAQVDWTMELVKENMWKPVQLSQIGKESTTEADTQQYTIVYENLNSFTGTNFGVSLLWPVDKTKKDSSQ